MSRIKVLVDGQLNGELKAAGKKLVVVDFTATWCGPCQMIAPEFESLSKQHPDVVFLKVDVDQCKNTAQEHRVSSMPTFHFWLDNRKVDEFSGADRNKLKSTIERLKPDTTFSTPGQSLGGGRGNYQSFLDNLESKQNQQQEQYQKQMGSNNTSSNSSNNSTANKTRPTSFEPNPIMKGELIEMGFPENRAIKALYNVQNSSSQNAMDWIFENMDNPTIDDPLDVQVVAAPAAAPAPSSTTTTTATTVAKTPDNPHGIPTIHSALCDMCKQQIIGIRYKCKVCPNYDLCQACRDLKTHQADHEFAEHTEDIQNYQLTPEERALQKQRLDEKVQEIRKKKAEEEAKREIEREISRRESGKSNSAAVEKWKEDAAKREAEKIRKEKEEDAKAKAKIKAKIEQDRLERFGKKPATAGASAPVAKPAAVPPVVPASAPKEYTDSTIQIRLLDGSTIKGTFPVDAKLIDIHTFLSKNTSQSGKFTLSNTYPRKIYTHDELKSISLKDAGLVPNGTLLVSKM
ncbi:hypothetical protein CYY_005528 [Polysphondylium violaceum]|uniref:ZZ-type zinc finger-containing protein n=1 Tax=Polysphondylium violaceum TaxID=133409 RepID=A0A8J4PU44_9MYCE|nr:hypothetical protein CYY_005528 [Polysphondylium violaceum]